MPFLQSRPAILIPVLFFGMLLAGGVLALNMPAHSLHPSFLKAVLADMMLTGPLICLALLAAKKLPLVTAVPFFAVGLNVALHASPVELLPVVDTLKWGSVSIIVGLLGVTAFKMALKTRSALPRVAGIADPRDKIELLASLVLGAERKAKIFAADWAFVRYAVYPPKNRFADDTLQMTSHKTSGFVPLLWALVGLVILETVILHVLVHLLSPTFAWILTLLSLYSLLSLIGHIRALPRRNTTFDKEAVTIRVGLFGQCRIPYALIERAEQITANTALPDGAARLGVLGEIEPANMMLRLHFPVEAHISHGFRRRASALVFHIDDFSAFMDEIDRRQKQVAHPMLSVE